MNFDRFDENQYCEIFFLGLSKPINDQCFPSHRNQPVDLQSKSIDWFLYDREHWSLMG